MLNKDALRKEIVMSGESRPHQPSQVVVNAAWYLSKCKPVFHYEHSSHNAVRLVTEGFDVSVAVQDDILRTAKRHGFDTHEHCVL